MNPPVLPMLAKRIGELPAGDGDEILIQSRDGKSLNRYFPELFEPLRSQLPERCVLDGEIVVAKDDALDFDARNSAFTPLRPG